MRDGICASWRHGAVRPLQRLMSLMRLMGPMGLMAGSVWLLAACGGGGGGLAPGDTAGNPLDGRRESLTLSTAELTASARVGDPPPMQTVTATIANMSGTVYGGATALSFNGITRAELSSPGGSSAAVQVYFRNPSQLTPGTYTDTVRIEVCLDDRCQRPITGSPVDLRVVYTVTAATGGGGGGGGGVPTPPAPPTTPRPPPVSFSAQDALPHDVIDAEFSPALNAVVMIASRPEPTLVVRDAVTGAVRQARLPKLPKALALSADGLNAAVGHDALVSLFSLQDLAQPARLLNVSADVGDLVLDGRDHVHVFPARDQWVSVHSIAVATNTERLSFGPRAGTRVRLHPNGRSVYGANNGLSPDDIEHYDISSGLGLRLRDSPYHGDHPMCGDLWISPDGATIYTACGRSFRASMDASQDMRYAGALTLSTTTLMPWRIRSLSQSTGRSEIVLIEESWYDCTVLASGECASQLAVYESAFLGRTSVSSLPMMTVAGVGYRQRGVFVFHRNDGARLVISRLDGMPNPLAEFLLGIVP